LVGALHECSGTYWEIIAYNPKKAGWSLGYISALDSYVGFDGEFIQSHLQLRDFEEQIFSMDQAIHREISKYPLPAQPRRPKDLGKLRAIVN
jgi:hypothetical protein